MKQRSSAGRIVICGGLGLRAPRVGNELPVESVVRDRPQCVLSGRWLCEHRRRQCNPERALRELSSSSLTPSPRTARLGR
ncbi:hypothetical protein THIOKS11400011 [Thiocapsa sp. KS1]|nr:hypothetical protein THIOKS11400011 [Thiocapsa sp. KS1]